MFVDTHSHLNFKAFEDDWLNVAENAKKDGVEKIIIIGTDIKTSKRGVEIAEKIDGLYTSIGFHPHHCSGLTIKQWQSDIEKLKELGKNKNVIAIGECGLDYHVYKNTKYENTEITEKIKNLQKKVFGEQIQLSKELNLPLIIHNREASKDIVDVIDHFSKNDGQYPKGVFHCISGSKKHLEKVLKMGFYIGIDGNITYSTEVQVLAKQAPLDKILLETDSPFLTPKPFRGLRNTPSNVKIVAQFLANIKNTSINQIEKITTENAKRLFKIY